MVEAVTNRASHEIANYAPSTNIFEISKKGKLFLVWWCCGTDIFDTNKKRNHSNFGDDIDAW